MRRKVFTLLIGAALITIALAALVGCDTGPKSDLQISAEKQGTVLERATRSVPAYEPTEFPIRESINWYLEETEKDSIWFVYMLSLEGRAIFYIVSDILPLSVCRSITAPDRIVNPAGRDLTDHVISAPSLTGTYGSSGECNDYFVRDATTGAFIKFAPGAASWIASNVPLNIETDLGQIVGGVSNE